MPSIDPILFPPDDARFREAVERAIAEVDGSVGQSRDGDDRAIVESAEALLRLLYPNVVIHPRDPIAEFRIDDGVTWHVYRDGRPTA